MLLADGPNHFRLAETAFYWKSTGFIWFSNWSYTFEVASISGSSVEAGTIGITSTSKKITGTDCLFRDSLKQENFSKYLILVKTHQNIENSKSHLLLMTTN